MTGTELLISVVFVIVLLLLSIIEAAFSTVNKIAVRRLLDTPKLKFVPQLASLIESRNEVLMSIHILIQLRRLSAVRSDIWKGCLERSC